MSTRIGALAVVDPQVAIPSADGFVSVVEVLSPSALEEPRARGLRGDTLVVWSPERGWLCQEHTVQPCTHTLGLNPPGLPQEI